MVSAKIQLYLVEIAFGGYLMVNILVKSFTYPLRRG